MTQLMQEYTDLRHRTHPVTHLGPPRPSPEQTQRIVQELLSLLAQPADPAQLPRG